MVQVLNHCECFYVLQTTVQLVIGIRLSSLLCPHAYVGLHLYGASSLTLIYWRYIMCWLSFSFCAFLKFKIVISQAKFEIYHIFDSN